MTEQHTAPQPSRNVPIISARRSGVTVLYAHAFLAAMAGLALRLLFVFRFPATTGDGEMYLQLARNWTDHHVYGLWLYGRLVPADIRMPGYPAFLAGVATVLGRSIRAISLSQALLDLCTCFLAAALAAALAPIWARRRAWIAGCWLAVTCPFAANYAAVVLTETLVTFLATAALLCFVLGLKRTTVESPFLGKHRSSTSIAYALLGAFLTGIATLVRPEMPLLLAAAALVYAIRWWRVLKFRNLALFGAAFAGVFLLPLAPWAARNFITLREVQILCPRYATLPSEYAPIGYYAWTRTWLERYRDVYQSVWKIGEEPLELDDLPPTAFDSPEEKARVATLFHQYNTSSDLEISRELDQQFAEIAAERTRRHPLRTYVQVPFERALTIWFTPRTELLPVDGKLRPLAEQWCNSPANVLTTAGFAALGYLYVVLALGGLWVMWRLSSSGTAGATANSLDGPNRWGIFFLLVYLVVRTAFLTTVEAPEPRYIVSCYPAVLAMAALLFAGVRQKQSR